MARLAKGQTEKSKKKKKEEEEEEDGMGGTMIDGVGWGRFGVYLCIGGSLGAR